MAPLADAILPYGRLHLTPNRPSLRQSWRQPFSNLIVDVKKLKLLYSEGPQAASGMWETANRSFQHIFNLHFSNPHALIQLASWWPQTFCHPRHDQLTNRADTFILHFTVYKISKNGLQLCFFALLLCFVLQNCSPSICLNHFTGQMGWATKDCDYSSKLLFQGKKKPQTDKSNSTNFFDKYILKLLGYLSQPDE